jgi:hypothetical protein
MGSCLSKEGSTKKDVRIQQFTKRPVDLIIISELTKNRLSLITNKMKIYKEVIRMLYGSKTIMDGVNGIKIGNGMNDIKIGNGINGMNAGNGVNAKEKLEILNGVAHT